jgi:hypothetical protein
MIAAAFLLMACFLLTVIVLVGSFFQNSYGSDLEQYIVSHNPQHPGDVERLTTEYNQKQSKRDLHL